MGASVADTPLAVHTKLRIIYIMLNLVISIQQRWPLDQTALIFM